MLVIFFTFNLIFTEVISPTVPSSAASGHPTVPTSVQSSGSSTDFSATPKSVEMTDAPPLAVQETQQQQLQMKHRLQQREQQIQRQHVFKQHNQQQLQQLQIQQQQQKLQIQQRYSQSQPDSQAQIQFQTPKRDPHLKLEHKEHQSAQSMALHQQQQQNSQQQTTNAELSSQSFSSSLCPIPANSESSHSVTRHQNTETTPSDVVVKCSSYPSAPASANSTAVGAQHPLRNNRRTSSGFTESTTARVMTPSSLCSTGITSPPLSFGRPVASSVASSCMSSAAASYASDTSEVRTYSQVIPCRDWVNVLIVLSISDHCAF